MNEFIRTRKKNIEHHLHGFHHLLDPSSLEAYRSDRLADFLY